MTWLLIEQGENPSSDYFVKPALAAESVRVCDLSGAMSEPAPASGTNVVFVRYLTREWRRWVEQHRASLGRLVFFMDDDVFDLRAFRGMPWRYQKKLFNLAWRHQRWLKAMGAELWVSSPWLAQKYSAWRPMVFEPQSPHALPNVGVQPEPFMKTVFYHGSSSHLAELEWLVPVVEQLLTTRDDVCFEVVGDLSVRQRFAHLHGVQVVHPMRWPTYKRFVQRPRTLGLAPLLDTPFNAARAPTKFFDITAAGAVGVYADTPVYQRLVRSGENGVLLPMDDARAWANEIGALLDDTELRGRLFESARCIGAVCG
ncbi:MAG: glycosyltransferase [Alteromonadaceae bacterium]|nr:glycosyltransferase [Alteromonadaceae bacterium]